MIRKYKHIYSSISDQVYTQIFNNVWGTGTEHAERKELVGVATPESASYINISPASDRAIGHSHWQDWCLASLGEGTCS